MNIERSFFVYILASKRNGTLYTGVTNNLIRRLVEHKEKLVPGFTSKYSVDKLVYFEPFTYIDKAVQREKDIKRWKRQWKIELIEEYNKEWRDLFYDYATDEDIISIKEVILSERKDGFLLSQE